MAIPRNIQVEAPRWYIPQTPQPAAGADWSITPTGQGTWIVWSFTALFTASAVAGNRTLTIEATDGQTLFYMDQAPALVAAAGVVPLTAYRGSQPGAAAGGLARFGWPSEGVILRQGDVLKSVTTGIDAGDAWTRVAVMVQELPSGPFVREDPTDGIYVEPLGW